MKNVIFAMTLMLVGCSGYQEMEDLTAIETDVPQINTHVAELIDKARHGDGKAYLELADCYREGNGVEKDFLNTFLWYCLPRIMVL